MRHFEIKAVEYRHSEQQGKDYPVPVVMYVQVAEDGTIQMVYAVDEEDA